MPHKLKNIQYACSAKHIKRDIFNKKLGRKAKKEQRGAASLTRIYLLPRKNLRHERQCTQSQGYRRNIVEIPRRPRIYLTKHFTRQRDNGSGTQQQSGGFAQTRNAGKKRDKPKCDKGAHNVPHYRTAAGGVCKDIAEDAAVCRAPFPGDRPHQVSHAAQ